MSDIPSDFGYWFSGFVDGEGSFMICKEQHRVDCVGVWFKPVFCLLVRDDDADIIHEVHTRLGFGKAYIYRHYQTETRRSKGNARYVCAGWKACLKLIEVIDRFPLRAKKRRDYEIWKKYVMRMAESGGKRLPDSESTFYYMRMKEIKEYSPEPKNRLSPVFSAQKKWEKGEKHGMGV